MKSRRFEALAVLAGALIWLGCPADAPETEERPQFPEPISAEQAELEEPDEPDEVRLTPDELDWQEGPAPGVQRATLSGDPTGTGPFVMRIRFPAGHQIQPHWHRTTEYVTVLSGAFRVALGEGADPDEAEHYPAGSFLAIPATTHITGLIEEETVVQVHGAAPFETIPVEQAE